MLAMTRHMLSERFALKIRVDTELWPRVTRLSDAPALVDAVRDQVGLSARVERGQPIRLFVIEHVGPLVEN
jgi:hypothetical protein